MKVYDRTYPETWYREAIVTAANVIATTVHDGHEDDQTMDGQPPAPP
jgi:hypothetical protein